ncbi:MAG: ThiF family adenylyltransferase [Gemmatimonadaceae bacterium]|nr:ThiF family adenylyltransferase [Gemmatimonadaceae bacterium]
MIVLDSLEQLLDLIADAPSKLFWSSIPLHVPSQSAEAFVSQCALHRIDCVDHLDAQIDELARVHHPADRDRSSREIFASTYRRALIAQGSYWMYFHWNRRFVHVLPRDDYFAVVTSRNHDKITREEQQRLRERVIGVVGLSVGGEIAVTVAQEHLCGRIKLADFDALELSNLNRLGVSVEDLGVNKAWLTARRIAAVNPWLEVDVFTDGLTDENANDFLDDLDLVIDECDSLTMKFRLRELAQMRRLNLVFAADERGMLSVEPYAHAEFPLFHGLVTAPHPPRSAYADDYAYFRALAEWLGGWDRLSRRSQDSLGRIGRDLAGYPQLAGEPRLAAGQVAHVARRLLLGEQLAPHFANFDLDTLVPGAPFAPPGIPLTYSLSVDWSDLDAFGHVNNVEILRYVQSARVHLWQMCGILDTNAPRATAEIAPGPLLASTRCHYQRPFTYPGEVSIATTVSFVGTTSFGLHHVLYRHDGAQAATADDVIVMFDQSVKKKSALTDVQRQALAQHAMATSEGAPTRTTYRSSAG